MATLKKSRFLEGAYIATACIIISKILGIIYVIPFYDIIGTQGGALYGYAYNIYNVFLTISSVGIPFAICKLTSEYQALGQEDKKIRMYRLTTSFVLLFSLISFLTCFIFAGPIAQLIIGNIKDGNKIEDVVFVIRCISLALLIVPITSVKRGYLQGHKFISQPSLSQVVEQFARIVMILVGSFLIMKLTGNVKNAVGISVLAAGFGGLAAYIYLTVVVRDGRDELGLGKKIKITKSQDKQIIKEVIVCAVPFIIINVANTLYSSTDMILVLNTLPKLGFSSADTEFVSSVLTTWGTKFNAIISAVSTGLIVSLIPHIVSDFTKKDMDMVNSNFNKCLKMIVMIIVPLACFISVMSNSFWTVFYGKSEIGSNMLRLTILVTILDCLYMVMNSLMQSLNKKYFVYVSVLSGLIANLVLDVPFMYLFKALSLPAYYGAVIATLLGFLISNTISLVYLKKTLSLDFKETVKSLPLALIAIAALIAIGLLCKLFLPVNSGSALTQIFNIAVSGILCGGVYVIISFKSLKTILPVKVLKLLRIKH